MNDSVKNTEAYKRLSSLFDDGIFTEIDAYAKSESGETAVYAGFGSVCGAPCYAFSQNVNVDDGAFTVAQCQKLRKVYEMATKTGYPIVGIYDSNGVKLSEGFEALSAYGDVVKASSSVSGVVPQISVVAGSCLGMSAVIANMADVVIAVKDADFYVTTPSNVTVEQSAKDGVVDYVADSYDDAVNCAKKLAVLLPQNNLSPAPLVDFSDPTSVCDSADAKAIVNSVADSDSFVEFKSEYGKNLVTGLGTVAGSTIGFVAFNGKAVCPHCAYKAETLVKLCDAYNIPVVTVANADGLVKEAESQMLVAATKLTSVYAGATCPKISVIAGQAVGAAYIILGGKGANADLTFAWDNAVASPLDVDGAVAFLYNDRLADGEDRAALEKEYKETVGSAFTAAACGAVDDIFAPQETRAKIIEALQMLYSKREVTIARKHTVK